MFTEVSWIKDSLSGELHFSSNIKRFDGYGTQSFKAIGVPTENDARRIVKEMGLENIPFVVIDVS